MTDLAITEVKKPTILQRLSLYEIALEGKLIEDILIEGDGELTPETEERMNQLLRLGTPKIEGAALIIKELEASEEYAKAESERLKKRQKAFERNADSLKARVVDALDAVFGGKVKTNRVTVYTQKAKDSISFEFLADESALENLFNTRPDLVKQTISYSLNKDALEKVWSDEAPLRTTYAMECSAAMAEAEEKGVDPYTIDLPAPPASIIPAVIAVTENEGRRFLQIR